MTIDRNAVTQEVPIDPETGKPYLNTVAAIQVSANGVGSEVSPYVAQAVKVIRESGLPQETNALFTNVEGDLDERPARPPRSSPSRATARASCYTWTSALDSPVSSPRSRRSSTPSSPAKASDRRRITAALPVPATAAR